MGFKWSACMFALLTSLMFLQAPSFAENIGVGEEKTSDEALVKAAEELITQDDGVTQAASAEQKPAEAKTTAASPTEAKESEIPVVLESKKSEKTGSNILWRLVASMALLAVVGGALIYATRRWTRSPNMGGNKARIEILHQYQLGTRRSLALVRVAGEVALIGVTDHNINMLKTVTLIDDEIEGLMGKDFNNFLEDEFSVEDVRSALSPRA